jgi:hypothetical protein
VRKESEKISRFIVFVFVENTMLGIQEIRVHIVTYHTYQKVFLQCGLGDKPEVYLACFFNFLAILLIYVKQYVFAKLESKLTKPTTSGILGIIRGKTL